jgi:hypothetical protein
MSMSSGAHGVIRVLLVWASPRNLENLKLAEEERIIRGTSLSHVFFFLICYLFSECLREFEGTVEVESLPACQVTDLHSRLTSQKYDIIHFGGHTDRTSKLIPFILEKYYKACGLPWPPGPGFKMDPKFADAVSNLINDLESDLYSSQQMSLEAVEVVDVCERGRMALGHPMQQPNRYPFQRPGQTPHSPEDSIRSPDESPTDAAATNIVWDNKKYTLKYSGLSLQAGSMEMSVDIDERFTYQGQFSVLAPY